MLSVSAALATMAMALPHASADPLSSKRAQAQALAAKIQQLGIQESALSEQYDGAKLAVDAANAQVAKAGQAVASAEAAQEAARRSLAAEAVTAYVHGGTSALAMAGNQPLGSVDADLVRNVYVGSLASTQNDAMDQYHLSALQSQDAKVNLQAAQAVAVTKLDTVASDRQAVQSSAGAMRSTLDQVNGQIAVLVAQAQAAQQAAQAQAERQALAAQQAAAAAQSASARAALPESSGGGLGGISGPSNPAPPVGSGAGEAVAAAMTRLGDPYVWGASGPSYFDCSGLVLWAWAQAGVSLPHFSGAQYSSTTQIPMSDLQPGDLVFPYDPGEHVAMYIGGGDIIEAPYTGAVVHVVPLSGFFVYATRVG